MIGLRRNGAQIPTSQATKYAEERTPGNTASGAIDAALARDVNAHATIENLFSSSAAEAPRYPSGVGTNLTTLRLPASRWSVNRAWQLALPGLPQ